MQTLEDRIERLERSCRRWRIATLLIAVAGCAVAASKPSTLIDGEFAHLTVQSLTVRGQANGPAIFATSDGDKASVLLATPGGSTTIGIEANKALARVLLSHLDSKGTNNAAITADEQSGIVSVNDAAGKTKELEPQ